MRMQDIEEFQDRVLFYQQYPPLHHHLTTLITNLAQIVWTAPHKKPKARFKRKYIVPNYKKASMTQEERAAAATKRMQAVFGALAK